MDRTQRRETDQSGFEYYLPATPSTSGEQGPVERLLKTVFRRRGDRLVVRRNRR